jgi:hypothetical protein
MPLSIYSSECLDAHSLTPSLAVPASLNVSSPLLRTFPACSEPSPHCSCLSARLNALFPTPSLVAPASLNASSPLLCTFPACSEPAPHYSCLSARLDASFPAWLLFVQAPINALPLHLYIVQDCAHTVQFDQAATSCVRSHIRQINLPRGKHEADTLPTPLLS